MNISAELTADRYVKFHAVQRYVERVLGIEPGPVVRSLSKGADAKEIAMAWCRDAGTSIDAVMNRIATPGVIAAIEAGVSKIGFGDHWMVVSNRSVVTFLPKQDRGKMAIMTKKERQNLSGRSRKFGLRRGRRPKGPGK